MWKHEWSTKATDTGGAQCGTVWNLEQTLKATDKVSSQKGFGPAPCGESVLPGMCVF